MILLKWSIINGAWVAAVAGIAYFFPSIPEAMEAGWYVVVALSSVVVGFSTMVWLVNREQ